MKLPINRMPDQEYVLISENFGGNLHDTAQAINRLGLADYVLSMHYCGSGTIVIYKVKKSILKELQIGN